MSFSTDGICVPPRMTILYIFGPALIYLPSWSFGLRIVTPKVFNAPNWPALMPAGYPPAFSSYNSRNVTGSPSASK